LSDPERKKLEYKYQAHIEQLRRQAVKISSRTEPKESQKLRVKNDADLEGDESLENIEIQLEYL